jgi:hypothetical protein
VGVSHHKKKAVSVIFETASYKIIYVERLSLIIIRPHLPGFVEPRSVVAGTYS